MRIEVGQAMKVKRHVSAYQMSFLLYTFMTGSSLVNIPGPLIGYAKNGAWISLLLSMTAGMAVLSCVLFLHRKFPELSFIESCRATVGNWVTAIFAVPFIWFQFHMTGGIVLDIGLFMTSSMMRQTPLYMFTFLIFVVVALTVRSGIETMARMFVVPMLFVLAFVILIIVLASPNYETTHLLPIMPDGIKPVVLGAYFSYGFPYVEVMVFAMLLQYVRTTEYAMLRKSAYFVVLFNGLCLIAVTLSTILVFGPMAGERKYSMFEVARTVDMMEVITRIESVIGFSLIVNSFMKASIMLFILNMTFTQLFKLRDDRILIFPLALISFLFSMLFMAKGETRWVNAVSVLHPLEATVGYLLPLLTVTAVAACKKRIA
jgi:spore germination protein KB